MIPTEQFIFELNKSISLFLPEVALAVTFILALILDLIFKKSRNISAYVCLVGFIVTAFCLLLQSPNSHSTFSDLMVVDGYANFFKWIILISSFLIVLISFFYDELNDGKRSVSEYYSLIGGMTFGMFLLAGATNLLLVYLAIETMSLSSYVLAGYTKEIRRASEASLKYVIFGAVSSGVMIYGISIVFGLTGSLDLAGINSALSNGGIDLFPLLVAGILIISGFAYKISAVPFHFWTPDVYEGAPITITAYLSVASKAAGFAIFVRFFKVGFSDPDVNSANGIWALIQGIDWQYLIAIIAVLTMTLGNLSALWQTNLKRLLAYSSIAHAGYMLMGVATMSDSGAAAILIYFVFYLFMNLGAFFVIMLLANKIGSEELEDYIGMGYRAPVLGVAMVIFLVSLTGLPPTAGFIGKFAIFQAVIESNMIWLAVVGILNSVVSLFYYVKIFRNLFLRGVDNKQETFSFHPMAIALLMVFVVPTLVFGLYWGPIFNWATNSVSFMAP